LKLIERLRVIEQASDDIGQFVQPQAVFGEIGFERRDIAAAAHESAIEVADGSPHLGGEIIAGIDQMRFAPAAALSGSPSEV
jgi:hypothetical protein